LNGLFVTGTDTEVGKTFVTRALVRLLRGSGVDALALKPVCAGSREDAEQLYEANDRCESLETINPHYFPDPLAPAVAAGAKAADLTVDALQSWLTPIRSRHDLVLIEGAGGWLVPLNQNETLADLALRVALPVLVVAADRLGCINHTLLTCEAIAKRDIDCMGVVLNRPAAEGDPSRQSNEQTIRRFCPSPVFGTVEYGDQEPSALVDVARQLVP